MRKKEVKKILKKINKLEKEGYIDHNSGSDYLNIKKNSIEIEFVTIKNGNKLYKLGKSKLRKFFKKKLKREVMIIDYRKDIKEQYFILYVSSKQS